MKFDVPEEMKALEITEYRHNIEDAVRGLSLVTKPVPKPKYGQVLVRMEASPCNPSDLLFLQGIYGVKKPLPTVPGWEGAGVVVASGGGFFGRLLVGKRVACAGQTSGDGTWAQYFVTDAASCIPLKDDVDFDQGASLIINPFTAIGMLDEAKKGNHRAIIQTGAASQVGRMVLSLAKKEGIPAIHIVRREEQKSLLQSIGADVVLNSESEGFREDLKKEAGRIGATIAFDAVAGHMTGLILNAMPQGSKVLVYGALAGTPCSGVSPIDLIFENKSVEGFWLTKWISQKGFFGVYKAANTVQNLVREGTIHTVVQAHVSLEEVPESLMTYCKEMTRGKVMINPSRA